MIKITAYDKEDDIICGVTLVQGQAFHIGKNLPPHNQEGIPYPSFGDALGTSAELSSGKLFI